MARGLAGILNREFNNLNQAALLLAVFTVFSQILGLLRDRAFTHFLGASSELDIYYAAFRVPDLLYFSVASLVSVTVLIPFLAGTIEKPEARRFLNNVFTAFLLVMLGISIVAFLLMPILAPLIAPGFSESALRELVNLSRIMLLSPILLGLSNLLGSVTQLLKRFLVFSLSPIFYNLGILGGIFFFYPIFGLPGLAWGVILGAFLHLLIQMPTIIKFKFVPRFNFPVDFAQIKKVAFLSLPRTLSLTLHNLALVVIVALTSTIGEGAISIFNLSLHLQMVPLAVIGISYSVAAFPTLTQLFSGNNLENFREYLSTAARQIIFWALPISFLFIVLRAQIVRVILGSGEFSWADTRLTAAALALFSISVLGQSLRLLFVKGYYAAGLTRRPLIISVVSATAIIVLSFLLLNLFQSFPLVRRFVESLLRVEGIPGTAVLMLPLAFSLGILLDVFLLWFFIKKDFLHGLAKTFLRKTFFQSFTASFFIGFVAYHFLGILDNVFDLNVFWGIFMQGFLAGLAGLIAGVVVLWLLGNQEIRDVGRALRTKFWRTRPIIAPDQENL